MVKNGGRSGLDTIKVNFVDFWVGLVKTDNYFFNLLSTKYRVVIDEIDPDLVFYSVDYQRQNEKQKYLGTRAKLVYYTGESTLPNWDECDLAFTFDHDAHKKNYRLPLWMVYLNWFNRPYIAERDHAYHPDIHDFLEKKIDKDALLAEKSYFCNFVYSQPSGKRVDFFPKLTSLAGRPVVSAGRLFNNCNWNIPGRSDNIEKIEFLRNFKFTISFENRDYLGYTTEKIIHPMFANSIPVYWGNDRVDEDFNVKSFILAKDYSDESLIEKLNEIDRDNDLYFSILEEPWFKGGEIPHFVLPENVLKRIECLI